MRQVIRCENHVDAEGVPAGGTVRGVGLSIDWQNGALGTGTDRKAPNGAFVEDVLIAVLQRLEHYQEGKFRNVRNENAIKKIEEALVELDARTTERQCRGVEGTHEV